MSGARESADAATNGEGARLIDHVVEGPQVLDLPAPAWVVDGMVPAGGLVMPYGPPKAGKSLVAIDLALSVATGRPWAGNQVHPGNVLYVAAEGVGGLAARVAAWLEHRDLDALSLGFTYWLTRPINLFDAGEVGALVDLCRRDMRVVLIVLDTFARCTVGAEANSASDMGRVVNALDVIRTATGAAVMPVHHAGKITSNGPRGSSALLGAVDAAYEITGDGKVVTMRCTAMKDAAMPRALTFKMVPAAESVALDAYDAGSTAPESVEHVLDTLRAIDDGEGVSTTTWQTSCEVSRRTFFYAKKWLIEAGKVTKIGARFTCTPDPG